MANSTDANTPPTFGIVQGARRPLDSGSDPSPRYSISRDANGAGIIVVMGVSGTGKSTLGVALANTLHIPFIDGDHLHPAENIVKMSRGEPLGDEDRWPWLKTIRKTAVARVMAQMVAPREELADGDGDDGGDREARRTGVIVACSALKKTYRAVLRGTSQSLEMQMQGSTSLRTYFVFLKGDRDVLMARMQHREGHFMKAGMLKSQLDTLECPEGEPGVVSVSVDTSTDEQVQRVVEMLRAWS